MKKPLTLANINDLAEAVNGWGGGASRLNLEFESLDLKGAFPLDSTIDPFSEDYVNYQIAIYHEISSRDLDQSANEHTPFDYRTHLRSANPYASRDVVQVARHVNTISTTIIRAGLPVEAKILDMGCGWGLSTEVLSFMGASVTSVDINRDFVNLVNDRCERRDYKVNAVHSGFDEVDGKLPDGEKYDAVFFYECLHHAVRPWRVIEHMARLLTPNGKLMLAGEPIQDIWWPAWGIRLDPLSVYCINQFGWFESGWSKTCLAEMAGRAGFGVEFVDGSTISSDPIFIGTKLVEQTHFDLQGLEPLYGWDIGISGWTSLGSSAFKVKSVDDAPAVIMEVWNYRSRDLRAVFTSDEERQELILSPGKNEVVLQAASVISVMADVWCPAHETRSDDQRFLAFTITKAAPAVATHASASAAVEG